MRWIAAGWITAALIATVTLGLDGVHLGHWPEPVHVLGHLILCGGIAALTASAAPGSPRARALWGWITAMALGFAIEGLQLRYGPSIPAILYDLSIDCVGGLAGLLLWGGRRRDPAHLVSAVLHPLVVAPLGFGMALFAVQRDLVLAVAWTALASLCLAPSVGMWLAGLGKGWFADADVSERAQRRPLFILGTLCALGFSLVAVGGPAPAPMLALAAAAGAVLGTAITAAGLKVSGHVTIPAAIGLLVVGVSWRGAVLLLAIALVLSWARVAAGRHRAREVVAGWGLAGVIGLSACLPWG